MTKNKQTLINEIENKIVGTKTLITNYKKQLANQEDLLQSFIKQLQEIKENMKLKNSKNNALSGINNTK
jgi:cell fate (sporulation/competence/biofilm development) regulator YmcA (YheA/YmcA/DUF963 family)